LHTLHEDLSTFMISLGSYNEKRFREKFWRKSKHILCSVTFFLKLWRDEIMWKNMVQQDRLQITIYGTCALHVRLQTHSQNV